MYGSDSTYNYPSYTAGLLSPLVNTSMASKTNSSFTSTDGGGNNLPGYAATEEPPPSYDYTPPKQYVVGRQSVTEPFVGIDQLKAHLALLRAFKQLKVAVEEGEGIRLPPRIRDIQAAEGAQSALRWSYIVSLAVERYVSVILQFLYCVVNHPHRFHRWLKGGVRVKSMDHWISDELPPLDVLMVWHAYMLNPV